MTRLSNPNATQTHSSPSEVELDKVEIPVVVAFTPTDAQRRAKAKLRTALTNSLTEPNQLTIQRAVELTENTSISQWNKQPGFFQWLTDTGEQQARIEYLFDLALDAAEQLLKNTDPKAQGARLNAIKVVGELASKFPRQKLDNKDDRLEQMDRRQLESFLQSNGVILEKRIVLDKD